MLEGARQWWRTRSTRQRAHAGLLALFTALCVGHQLMVWHWYIEDAAISFAYAQNLVEGYGLVPVRGGERVEGYSNPTWVALLALFDLVGIGPFRASKGLQLVLAALTVPLTYRLTAFAVEDDESDAPILAAGFLAGNAQFAIWGGCGLENALFDALLAGALVRMFVELRDGRAGIERRPWSAGLWLLVALSRPEAIAYAAVGGFASMGFSLRDGRGLRPTAQWLALFFGPFAAYHAVRFAYFAYELPQTYYAKVGDHREPRPFTWSGQGWLYVRNWAIAMGNGYLLPVYLIGMTGPRGGRALGAVALGFLWALAALLVSDQRLLLPVVLVFTFLVYLPLVRTEQDEPRPALVAAGLVVVGAFVGAAEWMRSEGARSAVEVPAWLDMLPPWLGLGLAVAAPLLAFGVEGSRVRVVCWTLLAGGLGFAIAVQGDWMDGWRWMNLVAVPGSVLLGLGAEAAARLAQSTVVTLPERGPPYLAGAIALLLAPVPANVLFTRDFAADPVTGPYSVRQRVTYKDQIKQRLHWYGPMIDLDVDMGAHLIWAPDHRMMDIAGLVDIPFAQHRFHRAFVEEYVFQERKPHMAHIHGGWASNSRIPTFAAWFKDYVEIPGYPAGDLFHVGNFLRRELVLDDHWFQAENRRVSFEAGIELVGFRIPSPEAAAGRRFYLEIGIQTHRRIDRPFRVIAFLADSDGELRASWELPPAYDWIPEKDWRRDEIFVGRYSPLLPEGLEPGTYELGFAIVQEDSRALTALALEPFEGVEPTGVLGGVDGVPARMFTGEVRFPDALQVVPEPEALAAADADRADALASAAEGRCGEAALQWFWARAHRPKALEWFDEVGPQTDSAIADCYAELAVRDPESAVGHLIEARRWDPFGARVAEVARPVAAELVAEGDAAWVEQDWETAYRAYSDAVAVEPTRAWARRWAEQARAERLGIGAENKTDKARARADEERRAELRRRRALEEDP